MSSCERGGLPAAIPLGGTQQLQITPLLTSFARYFYFQLSSLMQAWFGQLKIKIPQQAAGVICSCGERGIRTPGSPEGEQRFSRPPHSTTLPSLPSSAIALAKAELILSISRRTDHGVYPSADGPYLLQSANINNLRCSLSYQDIHLLKSKKC